MDIGSKIKFWRNKRGLTQAQLAKQCGISKNGLWNYENNKRKPNIEILTTIATELDISISDLLENQETLTSKLINYIDKKIYPDCDAINTLEIIAESIDLNFDELSSALNNNEDLSESYLSSMIKIIFENNKNLFFDFYKENEELIFNNYWICNKLCHELINKISVDKSLLNKTIDVAEQGQEIAKSWRDAIIDIESNPKSLLYTILNYLENTEEYYSYILVDMLNKKDPELTYFTDEQINDIVTKIAELVKYEIYKIEKNLK